MRTLVDGDTRQPVAFLNYPRPVQPSPHVPLGPSTLGEALWPVTVSADGLRVGLSYLPPWSTT